MCLCFLAQRLEQLLVLVANLTKQLDLRPSEASDTGTPERRLAPGLWRMMADYSAISMNWSTGSGWKPAARHPTHRACPAVPVAQMMHR